MQRTAGAYVLLSGFRRQFSRGPVPLAALLCIAVSIPLRIAVGVDRPFWLDEAWTGAIIAQGDLQHLFQQIYLDSNAPLYWVLMYGWGKLFGYSDLVLRLPSLLFGIAAPILIARSHGSPGLGKDDRLVWAAMLAVWFPAIWFSQEARCYSLLLLACTGQALAFARLIAKPTLGAACAWAAWSTLAILIHYHAAFVTLFQGLGYLVVCRRHAVRTWPAALVFTPALAWIAFHLPRLLEFTRPGLVWYSTLSFEDIVDIGSFISGTPALPLFILVAIAASVWKRARSRESGARVHARLTDRPIEAWVVVAASLGAIALMIVIGIFRPFLMPRYLIPAAPGFTLGIVLLWKLCNPPWANSLRTLVVASLCASAVFTIKVARAPVAPSIFSYEAAAQDLADKGITKLIFAWDNPTSAAIEPSTLDALGRFFFGRLDRDVAVTPVYLRNEVDANAAILDRARSRQTGILWLYDLNIHDTVARTTPPRIESRDPAWVCRNYAPQNFGVLACYRRGLT
jgi:Dolichyl-phosphate-mannose-protein mannosyltransferase